jgi:hypothetical protein
MMQLHLDEISRNVAEGAHAALILDRAEWHTTGKLDVSDNITPIVLPSHTAELKTVENVRQYLRQRWLSNTVFENYDAIVDAADPLANKTLPLSVRLPRGTRFGRSFLSCAHWVESKLVAEITFLDLDARHLLRDRPRQIERKRECSTGPPPTSRRVKSRFGIQLKGGNSGEYTQVLTGFRLYA